MKMENAANKKRTSSFRSGIVLLYVATMMMMLSGGLYSFSHHLVPWHQQRIAMSLGLPLPSANMLLDRTKPTWNLNEIVDEGVLMIMYSVYRVAGTHSEINI